MRSSQLQTLDNVLGDLRRGRGREGRDGRVREFVRDPGKCQVIGPEIVAPFGNAVGFVHGKKRNIQRFEPLDKILRVESLWRDVEQVQFVFSQSGVNFVTFLHRNRAVLRGGPESVCPGGVDLILHQRNERRNHDANAVEEMGGKLIAERFTTARGHDGKDIFSRENGTDNFFLMIAERMEAENVGERGGNRGEHDYRKKHQSRDRQEAMAPLFWCVTAS